MFSNSLGSDWSKYWLITQGGSESRIYPYLNKNEPNTWTILEFRNSVFVLKELWNQVGNKNEWVQWTSQNG